MKTKSVAWCESVSRRIVHTLASQFPSVAVAVNELVDNAVDRADKQIVELSIRFDRKGAKIIVESDGGEGMGAEEIAAWLSWGAHNHEGRDDIGYYGQGGKAACAFLGRDVALWVKKAGKAELWHLVDTDWATRTELRDFGIATPANKDKAPASVRGARLSRGHVRIEIRRAYTERRWNTETLKKLLSSTYAQLMADSRLKITVDGEALMPFRVPLDPDEERVEIAIDFDGARVTGWAGKVNKKALGDHPFRSGFRLYTKGRLIVDGEWFGYNWHGRGALGMMTGELAIEGLTPNLNKTDYVERSDATWDEISTEIISKTAGLIGRLRNAQEGISVQRAEQARALAVRDELSRVIKSLYEMQPPLTSSRRVTKESVAPVTKKKKGKKTLRPVKVKGLTSRRTFPQIEVRAWESEQRAAVEGNKIIVNKAARAYEEFGGSKAYIAEVAIEALLRKDPDVQTPDELVERKDELFGRWAETLDLAA